MKKGGNHTYFHAALGLITHSMGIFLNANFENPDPFTTTSKMMLIRVPRFILGRVSELVLFPLLFVVVYKLTSRNKFCKKVRAQEVCVVSSFID